MSAPHLKGRLLRGLDRWMGASAHRGKPQTHAPAPLSPLLQVLRRLRRLSPKDLTVLAMRRRFAADMAAFRVGFPIGSTEDVSIPVDHGHLPARLYRPRSTAPGAPLMVYFHGGGFVMGDLDTHDDACRLLCESSGMPLLAVAYRLAPEAAFPAAVDDAVASTQWARSQLHTWDAQGLAVGGDSAGANLAAVTALSLAREGHRLVAQLLIYPGTDLSRVWPSHQTMGSGYFLDQSERQRFYLAYLGDVDARSADPRVSPLLASVPPDMPPALVVTAGYDMLKDEGQAYARHLQAAGVNAQHLHFPRLGHAFLNLASVHRESRGAVEQVAQAWKALTFPRRST